MNPGVSAVEVLHNYQLELKFDNGETGIFSMQPYFDYPVFQPLKDYNIFKKAKATMGFVSWSSAIDLSHDTLYIETIMVVNEL